MHKNRLSRPDLRASAASKVKNWCFLLRTDGELDLARYDCGREQSLCFSLPLVCRSNYLAEASLDALSEDSGAHHVGQSLPTALP